MTPSLDNVVIVPPASGEKRLILPDVTLFKPDFSLLGAYFRVILELQKANMRSFGMKFV